MAEDRGVDGRSVRWERHKQERRQAIVQAAIELIEANPPGAEIHVQEIAAAAGLGRPAVYRMFEDRLAVDLVVQQRVIEMLYEEVLAPGADEGTVREVTDRLVLRYVQWAHRHRSLHRFAMRELPGRIDNPVRNAIRGISVVMRPFLLDAAATIGATLDQDDEDTVDLMIFGTVSQNVSAVRLWLARGDDRRPSPEALAQRLAQLLWHQLEGMARTRGATLSPDHLFVDLARRNHPDPA